MHAHATAHKMETCLQDFAFASIDFIFVAPVILDYDSQHLPATTAATSAAPASATSEATTTATEATTTASKASAATIEAATATKPPPRDPMLEKPRLLLLRALDPLNPLEPPPKAFRSPAPTARKITTAYAIGSAGSNAGATDAIRAANGPCAIAQTGVAHTVTKASTP